MSKTALEDTSHWYCLSREGMATLCTCEEDAKVEAANAQENYPRNGPYRTAQLVPYADLRALLADLEAAEKDAERYRALRSSLHPVSNSHTQIPQVCDPLQPGLTYTATGLDAAIDAALAQMAKGE